MTESPEPWASDVFVDEAEQEAADQYETALLEAEIKKGRLMVRAICGSCDQEKGGRNVTVARVFDSPLGPFGGPRSSCLLATSFGNLENGIDLRYVE